MLFDVAALLITSAALGTAAEASVAPQTYSVAASIDPRDTPIYGPFIAPLSVRLPFVSSSTAGDRMPLSKVAALTGASLLRQLSVLTAPDLKAFARTHPAAVDAILADPPTGVEVSAWWTTLDEGTRSRMVTSMPRLVGNLDGIPADQRDSANRTWITQSLSRADDAASPTRGRALLEEAQHRVHMLEQVEDVLDSPQSSVPRTLLSVDPSGQGTASVVIGDAETADYVTYLVPGMFFHVDGQIDDWTDDASRLYDEQVAWLNRLDPPAPGQRQKTVAVVAWMGYQTPDLTNIGSLDLAYKGRDALASSIQSLQHERAANEPFLTVIAHSYGSTAALMALTEFDFSVDALAVVGSPGSAAQSVDELHVPNGNVYVGAAAWDPVPNSGWFGSDPASASYGAHGMSVDGGVDPITGAKLSPSFGHNEYFAPNTESLRNMALIGVNHGELVTGRTGG